MSPPTMYTPPFQSQPQSQDDDTPLMFTPSQAHSLITTTTTFLTTYLTTNNHPPPHRYRPTPQTLTLSANAFLTLTEQPQQQPIPTIHPIFINPHNLFHLVIHTLTFLPPPPTYSSQRVFLEAVKRELERRFERRVLATMVPVWNRMMEEQTRLRREVLELERMFEVGMVLDLDLEEGDFMAYDAARAAGVLPGGSGSSAGGEQVFVSWDEEGSVAACGSGSGRGIGGSVSGNGGRRGAICCGSGHADFDSMVRGLRDVGIRDEDEESIEL